MPPVLLKAIEAPRGRHKLPKASGPSRGEGEGIKGAFHHRQERQLKGDTPTLSLADREIEIGLSAGKGPFQVIGVPHKPVKLAGDTRMVEIRKGITPAEALP